MSLAVKRVKANRYRPEAETGKPRATAGLGRSVLSKGLPALVLLLAMSLSGVWVYDAVVQSPFFMINQVDISGLNRLSRQEILSQAELDRPANIFDIHPDHIKTRLEDMAWVAQARVERHLFKRLAIRIKEQTPLAIVAIENLTDLVINTEGLPFKEYAPQKDRLEDLPLVTGVDLTLSGTRYGFEGRLFDAVMKLLNSKVFNPALASADAGGSRATRIRSIHGDKDMGIVIQAPDIYNRPRIKEPVANPSASSITQNAAVEFPESGNPPETRVFIPIKLGFDRFAQKLAKARDIADFMAVRYPDKIILAMDIYEMNRIFIKTEDALRHSLEKGV